MIYKRTRIERGESIELQEDLTASDVAATSVDYIAVLHDESATQTEYTRHRESESGSEIPDDAVVLELGEIVDYIA